MNPNGDLARAVATFSQIYLCSYKDCLSFQKWVTRQIKWPRARSTHTNWFILKRRLRNFAAFSLWYKQNFLSYLSIFELFMCWFSVLTYFWSWFCSCLWFGLHDYLAHTVMYWSLFAQVICCSVWELVRGYIVFSRRLVPALLSSL